MDHVIARGMANSTDDRYGSAELGRAAQRHSCECRSRRSGREYSDGAVDFTVASGGDTGEPRSHDPNWADCDRQVIDGPPIADADDGDRPCCRLVLGALGVVIGLLVSKESNPTPGPAPATVTAQPLPTVTVQAPAPKQTATPTAAPAPAPAPQIVPTSAAPPVDAALAQLRQIAADDRYLVTSNAESSNTFFFLLLLSLLLLLLPDWYGLASVAGYAEKLEFRLEPRALVGCQYVCLTPCLISGLACSPICCCAARICRMQKRPQRRLPQAPKLASGR